MELEEAVLLGLLDIVLNTVAVVVEEPKEPVVVQFMGDMVVAPYSVVLVEEPGEWVVALEEAEGHMELGKLLRHSLVVPAQILPKQQPRMVLMG